MILRIIYYYHVLRNCLITAAYVYHAEIFLWRCRSSKFVNIIFSLKIINDDIKSQLQLIYLILFYIISWILHWYLLDITFLIHLENSKLFHSLCNVWEKFSKQTEHFIGIRKKSEDCHSPPFYLIKKVAADFYVNSCQRPSKFEIRTLPILLLNLWRNYRQMGIKCKCYPLMDSAF